MALFLFEQMVISRQSFREREELPGPREGDLPAKTSAARPRHACRWPCPTGKSAKAVQPHPEKYSAFAVGQISATSSPVSRPQEGRIAIVTDVGRGMRWTRWRAQDERRHAYGEVVWSRRPDAGVKFVRG